MERTPSYIDLARELASEAGVSNVRFEVAELAAPLITCEAVIAEACYLLRRIRGASAAVLANVDSGAFLIRPAPR